MSLKDRISTMDFETLTWNKEDAAAMRMWNEAITVFCCPTTMQIWNVFMLN